MSNTKKVIVTGVTGQDGSYMLDYLLENTDYKLYGVTRRSSNLNLKNISHLIHNPRVELVTGDLSDSQSIDNLVREIKPDYFINLGAQSFVGSSWQIPEQTFDVGALGVLRCLESIRKHAPSCRFYNAGSSEELGNVDYYPQDEKHPLKPRSPYGAAKAAARHIVKVYRESYNLYAIQGLLYNHESERRGEEFVTRKITKGVARIKKALDNNELFKPIELGNLDAKRDWSHALDFVDGIWKMLNQPEPKEYILSSNETHSIREFIDVAFQEVGISGKWEFVNGNDSINEEYLYKNNHDTKTLIKINTEFYRPAEVDLLLGDSTKARIDLNWNPKINFNNLVKLMVQNDINVA
jgi:GDPmannose 4,6-dehydratase